MWATRSNRRFASIHGGGNTVANGHARLPLEPGMVVSIETTMKHPKRGFIKLEDTVAVTGYEIFGEGGRGWNLGGSALASLAAVQ
ncbi:M24 family metallopeptidase [Bradyrhizobium sp. cf659]|uniref:M24 family metallopeptidase n=1 Tax=Bradyrhizobium sp. cf659 TaxID=1761771 RepID=UPI0024BFF2EA|nr:M24 family metallopeptidase [Bradyrhizobium sp. cf659]